MALLSSLLEKYNVARSLVHKKASIRVWRNLRSRTLLKIYVSINLKHRSGKLDSLIWLFFRCTCTSLCTEPHHSVLISCSVLKDLSNIKNPILQKNSTLHAEKTESELCKLPFVFHQEKLKHFFSPYTFDERSFPLLQNQ